MKTCTKCQRTLPAEHFYDAQYRCKDCIRAPAAARARALSRLASRHEDEFRQLYVEEKAKIGLGGDDQRPRRRPRRRDRGSRRPDRDARMLNAYVHDDMTLEQVAQYHDVSRERVRQILERTDPTLYRLAKRRRKARSNLRAHGRSRRAQLSHMAECRLCGEPFEVVSSRRIFCSEVHYQVWLLLRYQADDDSREAQRTATAKHILRTGVGSTRYAQNMLDDTVGEGVRAGARYLLEGSLAMHWALRAYVLDWPVFDSLHPDVQAQVKAKVGATTT